MIMNNCRRAADIWAMQSGKTIDIHGNISHNMLVCICWQSITYKNMSSATGSAAAAAAHASPG
jgi:hypothetical protein